MVSWKKKDKEGQGSKLGNEKPISILLLTNRDSDNNGDKVIEACDIALIRAVMKNLGIKNFSINSRAASIISQEYLKKQDVHLLANAKKLIEHCDIVVFGGAPLFNWLYQNFYERTAVTLELCEKYKKPAIFSAIGIEGYSEDNPKCQRLKEHLNLHCVRQITTRDGYPFLEQYKTREDLQIGKVADPAIFTAEVFKDFTESHNKSENAKGKKKIGIFVLRFGAFNDNGFELSQKKATDFWVGLAKECTARNYDFEFLSSGHFNDEAVLDYLIRNCGIQSKNCIFNLNSPEELVQKISSYDAVITCRLHPSIIAYSLEKPSIGIIWNPKVEMFYDSVDFRDRLVSVKELNHPDYVLDKLENAMQAGVKKDTDYIMTLYYSLFNGLKCILSPESKKKPYELNKLKCNIPNYTPISSEEYRANQIRRLRRMYKSYNELADFKENHSGSSVIVLPLPLDEENQSTSDSIGSAEAIKSKVNSSTSIRYEIRYNSGAKSPEMRYTYTVADGIIQHLSSGSLELTSSEIICEGNQQHLKKNQFVYKQYRFVGWKIRIKIQNIWYWYLSNGTLYRKDNYHVSEQAPIKIFPDEAIVPNISLDQTKLMIADAVWEKESSFS